MNRHADVMSRVLTGEFYRVNAMFFLVVIAFCFGFMRGAEHLALASYFVSSIWLVLIPVGVWMFYTIKVILFNKREARQERTVFLTSLPLLPFYSRTYACLVVSAGQLMPAIAYGIFLVIIAAKYAQFASIAVVLLSLIVLTVITSWYLHRTLVHPERENLTATPVQWLDKRFTKSMTWMFVEGIVRSQPGMIYVTKIVTCLVIYGATHLYLYDDYDARLYLMTACGAFGTNLALVYEYQRFEVVYFPLLQSLPLGPLRRQGVLFLTMAVLCFPEIAMLATNLPAQLDIKDYVAALIFGFSILQLGYGVLYVRDTPFESFTRQIFFVTMGWILLILFSVPIVGLAALNVAVGEYLLVKNFYSFELNSQP